MNEITSELNNLSHEMNISNKNEIIPVILLNSSSLSCDVKKNLKTEIHEEIVYEKIVDEEIVDFDFDNKNENVLEKDCSFLCEENRTQENNNSEIIQKKIGKTLTPYINTFANGELNLNTVNRLLETEKCHNKSDSWNKLDKTAKLRMLYNYAEKYGKHNKYTVKEISGLKLFFLDCLEKLKLQKIKDVIYNKDIQEITTIPSLLFNINTRNFTLKIMDPKRVSTLKSLTPKRSIKIETVIDNKN